MYQLQHFPILLDLIVIKSTGGCIIVLYSLIRQHQDNIDKNSCYSDLKLFVQIFTIVQENSELTIVQICVRHNVYWIHTSSIKYDKNTQDIIGIIFKKQYEENDIKCLTKQIQIEEWLEDNDTFKSFHYPNKNWQVHIHKNKKRNCFKK